MKKLFISYRSLDSAKVDSIVFRIMHLKPTEDGKEFEVWQDKKNIDPGEDWWDSIVDGIINCDIFVFMVSDESVKNINCRAELSYARKLNIPIIPIVLEGEYFFNDVTGKQDVSYWDDMPEEILDGRFQFLWYEGTSFISELRDAIGKIDERNWRRLSAERPPDPRHADDAENDTSVLYSLACDLAFRGDYESAEEVFLRLMNHGQNMFTDFSLEWIEILRKYAKINNLHRQPHTRFAIPPLWAQYVGLFPKPFLEPGAIFDPIALVKHYGQTDEVQVQPPPPELVEEELPVVTDYTLPDPFSWIAIPDIGYSLSKYPITNAQFEEFINAGGYQDMQWWTEIGWKLREDEGWVEPRYWDIPKWKGEKKPVVGVSWFEAMAFCKWLSSVLSEDITLPTVDQWEYAAQGEQEFLYPWGNQWIASNCNNDSKATTSVTAFEGKGNSPFGVVDMAGNVREWCLTDYDSNSNEIDIKSEKRILRGGAWNKSNSLYFRCKYSDKFFPGSRYMDRGFRICRING